MTNIEAYKQVYKALEDAKQLLLKCVEHTHSQEVNKIVKDPVTQLNLALNNVQEQLDMYNFFLADVQKKGEQK